MLALVVNLAVRRAPDPTSETWQARGGPATRTEEVPEAVA